MGQSLLIRRSAREHVLRSVGAAPNGIVGLTIGEGEATWVINSRFEPTGTRGPTAVDESHEGLSEPVSVADLVTACEGAQELYSLCRTLLDSVQAAVSALAPEHDWHSIRAAVDLLEDTFMAVREALHMRGISG